MKPQDRERITVVCDGKEIDVFNWVNVKQPAIVRGHNPVVERFNAEIGAGDSTHTPEAVTPWLAEELELEFSIDVTEYGIEIIDPTSEEVDVV